MVDRAGSGLRFDTGIEQIIRQDGSPESRLPEMTSILPSPEQMHLELDTVLRQPSLTGALEAFVRPEVHERDILMPNRFATLFHDVRDLLEAAVPTGRGNAEELRAAARLLEEEQVNRDLLETYRNTLLGA